MRIHLRVSNVIDGRTDRQSTTGILVYICQSNPKGIVKIKVAPFPWLTVCKCPSSWCLPAKDGHFILMPTPSARLCHYQRLHSHANDAPASTKSSVTVSDRRTATSSSCRQSNCLHMDGVLLVCQGQLLGTASRIISETPHYPSIRLGAISKPTFLQVVILLTSVSARCRSNKRGGEGCTAKTICNIVAPFNGNIYVAEVCLENYQN